MRLQDKVATITGAGSGMGRTAALMFAAEGAKVVVAELDEAARRETVCPGPVETPLLMDWLVKDEEAKRVRLARNPTGRFGKPEEILSKAIYLASNESRWTNGAAMVVDGGISVDYF